MKLKQEEGMNVLEFKHGGRFRLLALADTEVIHSLMIVPLKREGEEHRAISSSDSIIINVFSPETEDGENTGEK